MSMKRENAPLYARPFTHSHAVNVCLLYQNLSILIALFTANPTGVNLSMVIGFDTKQATANAIKLLCN